MPRKINIFFVKTLWTNMIGFLFQLSDTYPECFIYPIFGCANYMLNSWKNGQKFGWYH